MHKYLRWSFVAAGIAIPVVVAGFFVGMRHAELTPAQQTALRRLDAPTPPVQGKDASDPVLKLKPQASVTYPIAPSGKSKADAKEEFGGVLTFDGVAKPGVYQVTLSSRGWIDVVQGGAALSTVGHTGMKDCDAIRKSVRFEIGSGPFAVQLSGVPQDTIKIAVRAAN